MSIQVNKMDCAFSNAKFEDHNIYNLGSCESYDNIIRNDEQQPILSRESRIPINIYRYKFTQEFMDELHKFSKIHQYDDRKTFKEAWNTWIEENSNLIQNELERLTNLNYDGDILDKMFKSARYYFRKKSVKRPEPKDRRQYLSVQKDLLDAMDVHISKKMKESDYKPSDGFADFCNTHLDLLRDEVTRLVVEHNLNDVSLVKDKIKKTYKNRYFIMRETKKQ